jgi:hypothetical protein
MVKRVQEVRRVHRVKRAGARVLGRNIVGFLRD